MQRFYRMGGIGVIALGCAVLAGCQAAPSSPPAPAAATIVPYRPPPKLAEIPPPAPSPRALWQSGHWCWTGAKYEWTRGRYAERPAPTANWIPDYWREEPDGWTWVAGQWTS